MKSVQDRILAILNEKGDWSLSNTDVVNLGMTVKEIARRLDITEEEATEGLSRITRLVSFPVGTSRFWFKTEKSLCLYARDARNLAVELQAKSDGHSAPVVREDPDPKKPKAEEQQSAPEPRPEPEIPRYRNYAPGRDVILETLAILVKPTTVQALCDKLGLDYHRNVTGALRVLRESAYIERVPMERCPTCGHRKPGAMYRLTDRGKIAFGKLMEAAPK